MLIELLCPKCKGPLELDKDLKIGTCPFCGTKSLVTESIPNKIDIQLPEIYSKRSDKLVDYSYNMLIQGENGPALESINEALRLNPDNVRAWILYTVLTKNPLKKELMSKLDLKEGLELATDLSKFDRQFNKLLIPIYPELDPNKPKNTERTVHWSEITPDTTMTIELEYNCKKRKDSVVHFYNMNRDDLTLSIGPNTLELASGVHLFYNTITKTILVIVIPNISSGTPYYFSTSSGSKVFTCQGQNLFKRWDSYYDCTIVNVFVQDDDNNSRIIVDCSGLQERIEEIVSL